MNGSSHIVPAESVRRAKPHRGPGTSPKGHGADHRGTGSPEVVGRQARPRARRLPPPRRGEGRSRRPERLGEEHPVPAPRGRDGAGPGGPRAQAGPPLRLPPAGPERPAGDRRAGRPLRPEPGGAADRGGARRPRGVDGPSGRLGRRGRERAHGPLRVPPRRPRRRPQPERDRQRPDPQRPGRRRGAPRPAVRLPLRRREVQGPHRARPREREGEGRPPARRADEPHGRRHDRDDRGVPPGDRRGRPPGQPRQVPPRRDRGQGDRDRPPPDPRVRRQLHRVPGAARRDRAGPGVVRLEGVAKSHGGRLLFADVDLELAKGDKVGLVGPNGAGKTTLLEVLIGRQEADAGSVFRGKNLKIGYFAQEAEELDFSRTLLEEISSVRNPPPSQAWARGLLGRFWFRGDAVHSRVGQLSGGERARLALAKFIAQDYDLLVLDEPTNHLDIESQEIVAAALRTYPGMVLVVSHNRSFLNEVANKIAVIAHRRLAVFQGTFKDSWAAAKMAEFMAVQQKPRYRVLRVVKDWETGTAYHGGDVIGLNGAETQAFLRLLRWAEANGRVERLEA